MKQTETTGNDTSLLDASMLRQNLLLGHLTGPDAESVLVHGNMERLELRQKIYDANAEIDTVYFPLTCVLSVVSEMQDGGMIEVGTIGYEGVSAIPIVLGSSTSANQPAFTRCVCKPGAGE